MARNRKTDNSMKMNIRKTAFTAAFLIASCLSTTAQVMQASRTHYSTEDGLTSNAISDIVQDDLGYVWIATWNGLSRFDGFHFYNYQTGAGSHIPLLHNRISRLYVDMQQNIWMRMYDGRVFVVKRSTDRIINPFEGINGYEEFQTSCRIMMATNGEYLSASTAWASTVSASLRKALSHSFSPPAGLSLLVWPRATRATSGWAPTRASICWIPAIWP